MHWVQSPFDLQKAGIVATPKEILPLDQIHSRLIVVGCGKTKSGNQNAICDSHRKLTCSDGFPAGVERLVGSRSNRLVSGVLRRSDTCVNSEDGYVHESESISPGWVDCSSVGGWLVNSTPTH